MFPQPGGSAPTEKEEVETTITTESGTSQDHELDITERTDTGGEAGVESGSNVRLNTGSQDFEPPASGQVGTVSDSDLPPPLPPRPVNLIGTLGESGNSPKASLQVPKRSVRPVLPSQATTALSLTDVNTQLHPDGSRETYANSVNSTRSEKSSRLPTPTGKAKAQNWSEGDDSASVRSFAPTLETGGDAESMLGDVLGVGKQSPAWRLLSAQYEEANPFDSIPFEDDEPTADFSREFDEIGEIDSAGDNEGTLPILRFPGQLC